MKNPLLTALGALCMFTGAMAQCGNFGTGANGAYAPSSSTTLAGGTYNFTTFNIPNGVTITVTGSSPLIIYCTGAVTIDGLLTANGGNGANGVTYVNGGIGGTGVAGGGNGGAGTFASGSGPLNGVSGSGMGSAGTAGGGWSGGGGAGYSAVGSSSGGVGGFGGPAYGAAAITGNDAGSGGGGGSGGYDCGAGGGGGGGGYIYISAPSITISATGGIGARGGNGGSDGTGNCGGGGGGSGGSVFLSALTMTHNGTITVAGGTGGASNVPGNPYYGTGANGAPGRIRLDYNGALNGTGTTVPAVGYHQTVNTLQTAAVVTQNVSCFGGNDGAALATNMNGTPPYTSSWSPSGGNSTVATGLAAGTYTYTVTDNSGCTATATVVITEPPVLTVSTSVTSATCAGSCDGSGTATGSGGVPNYSYAWAPTTPSCAGTYTDVVTDQNGCTANGSATVTEPPALVATAMATSTSCYGACDGTLTGMASGGTPGYTYMWMPGNIVSSTISGVCAGCYTLTVTDANGCSAFYTVCVTQPAMANVNLLGNDTMICLNAVYNLCAPAGYSSYMWSNASTAMCINADTTTCYWVTVSDSTGCMSTDTVCVTEDPCLGIAEANGNVNVIYPNPANELITITFSSSEMRLVEIIDVTGKICIAREVENNAQIDISSLTEGIYTVRIGDHKQKLVIAR